MSDIKEDIKILKEMQWNCLHLRQYKDETAERKAQAIENILNRLEQLEKENDSLVAQYERQGAIMVNEYILLEDVEKLFIPKNKIRNKIEELEKQQKYCDIDVLRSTEDQIDILKELLEGNNE